MKNFFTITIIILSSLCSFAQTEFAPLGAKWSYKGSTINSGPVCVEWINAYECIKDSAEATERFITIQEVKKQQTLIYNSFVGAYQYSDRQIDTNLLQLKVTIDTVFYLNPIFERYTPLYVFNVGAGDTFQIPITDIDPTLPYGFLGPVGPYSDPDGDSVITYTVDSIAQQNLGGQLFKHVYVHNIVDVNLDTRIARNPQYNWYYGFFDAFNDTLALNSNGGFNNLFGGLSLGLLPRQFGTYFMIDQLPTYQLSPCSYSDSNLTLNMGNNCDSFIISQPVSLSQLNKQTTIEIYPNPAQNTLHIDLEKPTKDIKIKIVNLLGSAALPDLLIKEQQNTIDIGPLNPGIYLMILESEGERYYHKFVKQ